MQEVVGDAVSFHLTSLRDQVVKHLIITNPIDREKDEDSTTDQCSTDSSTKDRSSESYVCWRQRRFLIGWFSSFEIEVVSNANPHNFEWLKDDRATRGSSDVPFSTGNKDDNGEEEYAEGEKISRPEINVGFELGRCQTGEATDVDGPVEPSIHSLDCNGGIDNDAFAVLLDFDETLGIGILFNNQCRDIGLDSSSTKANDNHGDDKAGGVSCSTR